MPHIIAIPTTAAGLYEFTRDVSDFVRKSAVTEGVLTSFVQHTSSSLLIQENADPDVRRDLDEFFRGRAPPSDTPQRRSVIAALVSARAGHRSPVRQASSE